MLLELINCVKEAQARIITPQVSWFPTEKRSILKAQSLPSPPAKHLNKSYVSYDMGSTTKRVPWVEQSTHPDPGG